MTEDDRRGSPRDEETRVLPPGTREFVGFTELQPGQNFYDQPPFDTIIGDVIGGHAVDKGRITSVLTAMAKKVVLKDSEREAIIMQRYRETPGAAAFLFSQPHGTPDEVAVLQEVLTGLDSLPQLGSFPLVQALNGFPSWFGYIRTKLDEDVYEPDGKYKPHSVIEPTPSYFVWLERYYASQGRIRKAAVPVVVSQAFPQQLLGRGVDEVIPKSGHRETRIWTLRDSVGTAHTRKGRA